ncbi:hypothetical protein CAP35_04945 [Chitinophagaceae bacterium IBVUCB1]|nr:hypothetical protein CAP35_04945 [Chitinophagaceae bacterium IBVUCB1]
MRFFKCLLVFVFLLNGNALFAQKNDVKQPRILVLLDGSSSMSYEWTKDESRFKAASRIILSLIDSMYKVNKDVEFALRVYGHQYPSQQNNCFDTRLEVMFSKNNLDQMGMRLDALEPIGVSPIAFSLKEAAEWDFEKPYLNTYSLILVTDGAESCGGDICDVVKKLLDKKIDFKPYILSLVDNPALKNGYDCLGTYLSVAQEKDIKPSVGKIVDAYTQMIALQRIDKKLLKQAVVNAPSVLKVDIPEFKVKQEDPEPVKPDPKPQPVVSTPPVVTPPVKQTEPTKDLTNRTNETPEPVVKQLPISTLQQLSVAAPLRTFRVVIATRSIKPVKLPRYTVPVIKDEPAPQPKVVAAPPVKKPTPPAEIVKPKVITDSTLQNSKKETTLQVYLSDGNRNYDSAPLMAFIDKNTKKEVFRFQRTVDAGSIPHRHKVPVGNYYLTIIGSEQKYTYDITILPNENNAIIIPISNGTLVFGYEGNDKRKITGYVAKVSRRFDRNVTPVLQSVAEERAYEPGTYNVIIETLPPFNRTFDLEIGTQKGIMIPEEGDLVIANNTRIGKVTLYYPIGDRFRPFLSINIDGNGTAHAFRMLPGTYKAGYKKNPELPLQEETMVEFTVKSNIVTNLELTK